MAGSAVRKQAVEVAPVPVPVRRGHNAGPQFAQHFLGLGVLLLAVVPAYLIARPAGVQETEIITVAEAREDNIGGAVSDVTLLEIEAHIREVAARYGVSPRLVAAIIEAESEFNPRAVSRKGARGLMQLMPATAVSLQVEDSFDPFENIDGGVRHLRRLLDRFQGNLPLAIAAYNAGEQAVVAHGGIPPYRETRRYVSRILRRIGYARVASPAPGDRPAAVPATQMVSTSAGRGPEIRPAVMGRSVDQRPARSSAARTTRGDRVSQGESQ
jgi:hypothetical protein